MHGIPRTTRGIDLFIKPTKHNAERLLKAMQKAGFGTAYLIDADRLMSKQITVFADYIKVDVLIAVPGIEFGAAWKRRKIKDLGSVRAKFLSLEDLIATKRAAGRARDWEDVALLEAIQRKKQGASAEHERRLEGMRIVAIIAAFIIAFALLGAEKPKAWRHPIQHLKAWWLNQKGQKAFRAGKTQEALQAFRQAQQLAGKEPLLRFNEGTALTQMKRWDEAERTLRDAVKSIPPKRIREQSAGHYNLGNLYFAQRRWDDAAKAYIAALKRTPSDWDAKFNLELVLRQQRQRKEPKKPQKPPPPPPLPPPPDERNIFKRQLREEMTAPWHGERDW